MTGCESPEPGVQVRHRAKLGISGDLNEVVPVDAIDEAIQLVKDGEGDIGAVGIGVNHVNPLRYVAAFWLDWSEVA